MFSRLVLELGLAAALAAVTLVRLCGKFGSIARYPCPASSMSPHKKHPLSY